MKHRYFLSIVLILLGGIIGNTLRYTEKTPDKPADFSTIPFQLDDYTGVESVFSDVTAEILKADLITSRIYRSTDNRNYQLFIAYFNSQKYGSQIHSPKHCLPGGGWRIESLEPFQLHLNDGTTKTINHSVISNQNKKVVVLYWYETRSGLIKGEYGLKFDLMKNALMMKPTDAAIIRITIDVTSSIEEATRAGEMYISTLYPYIEKALPF